MDDVEYDTVIAHMRRFEDNVWVLKDMWDPDVQQATSYRYSLLGERNNGWELEQTEELPFDFNTGVLSVRFKRKLVGGTSQDYTMMLDIPMEVRWTFGAWFNDQETELARCIVSPKFVEEPRGGGFDPEIYKRNITLYTPTIYSGAMIIAASLTSSVMLAASLI